MSQLQNKDIATVGTFAPLKKRLLKITAALEDVVAHQAYSREKEH